MKVPAGLVSGETSFLRLQIATFLLCLSSMHGKRERPTSGITSSLRTPVSAELASPYGFTDHLHKGPNSKYSLSWG